MTSFSLALRDLDYVKDFTYHIHEHGWTVLRVGAQTAFDWCPQRARVNIKRIIRGAGALGTDALREQDLYMAMSVAGYLPCGPAHGTAEADANLIRLLDVTARIPDIWVQLIPTFTYKSHDEGSQRKNIRYFNAMFDHVHDIVTAGDYKHVVYEVFNEVVHPLSQHIKDEDVREMFLHIKSKTDLPVGTDYHGGGEGEDWRGRYPFVWRDVSNYLAFHTPRNPEPSYATMEDAQDKYRYNAGKVWVDETVCFASDANIAKYPVLAGKGTVAMLGRGTEDGRMAQVVRHLRDVVRLGWKPTFHSIWGMQCVELGLMPNYNLLEN